MSWQGYIDEQLLVGLPSGGRLTHAAIIGHDGGMWASDPEFPPMSQEEIAGVVGAFGDDAAYGELAGRGLYIAGNKFQVIQGVPGEVLRGKAGAGGCTIKKTKQTLVVGIYDSPVQPGECSLLVENLGDYLISMDY